MRRPILAAFLSMPFTLTAQTMRVTVTDDLEDGKGRIDQVTRDLFDLLSVQHYSARFTMPRKQKHDVVVAIKSVYKDSIASVDTLLHTAPWRKKVVGGFPWDPKEGMMFMAQRVDSMHIRVRGRVGASSFERTIRLPRPDRSYRFDATVMPTKGGAPAEMGKPFAIMALSQPYPDPPPPKEAVVYRYCFSTAVPPEEWPTVFGVPHLYVIEVTVLP